MNRFVISDTHFGHASCWAKFKRPDGSPLRPFTSTEEMDDTMVDRWNAKVGPKDTVYHLGDVAIARRHLATVNRLNGRKILIRGNHDLFKDKDYYMFEQLCGVRVFTDKFILSHIPLHPGSVGPRFRVNVHGHTHANEVTRYTGGTTKNPSGLEIDPRYLCVSVEHTNYEPISFEEVEERIQTRWAETGYVPPENMEF